MSKTPSVVIVGAGLAGTEAALRLAARGIAVRLYDQKPESRSAASAITGLAELVCSNSLRAENPENAVGLLKEELRRLGSTFMEAALATRVPAGGALAVDRERFSAYLTNKIANEPNIELCCKRLERLPFDEAPEVILASGPLTEGPIATELAALAGADSLAFYDAIAPIIDADSIDYNKAFFASRYDKGDGDDYLNLPLSEEEYRAFVAALIAAEKVPPRPFEDPKFFEGCLPVDVMAERGPDTLAYGPMKPVGLVDPNTGKRPFALVQLRAENKERTAFNLVGFQTRLKQGEQAHVFRMLPGLEKASFLRFGSVHRNSFLNAPLVLSPTLQLKAEPRLTVAGQLAGVEGYVESAACGLLAAEFVYARLTHSEYTPPPAVCALGGLWRYLHEAPQPFTPSNVTLAMLPALGGLRGKRPGRKRMRKQAHMERAREAMDAYLTKTPDTTD